MTRDYSAPEYNPVAGWTPYPDTEEGWKELYDFRWQMYLLYPYSGVVQQNEHLFRAFDDSGNEIDQTRRIFRYYAFVADVDARALHGGKLTLETQDFAPGRKSKPAQLIAGETIWKRSRTDLAIPKWCKDTAVLGDCWVEAIRTNGKKPYDVKLVGHDPRVCTATYDAETGTELVELRICLDHQDAHERLDGQGAPTIRRYERILTREKVEVYRDGELSEKESGPHGCGVVPAVHMQAIPFDQPEHSLPAPAGIERGLMHLDSLATQGKAIATRFANPTLASFGFKLGPNSAVQKFGRMVDGIPKDGRLEYVEAKFAQLPHVLDFMKELHAHIRDTSPEFLFASDAAQESAEARSLRGQAFESKMQEMRGLNFAALAEITAIAVAMEEDRVFDLGTQPFKIEAGPILPRNVKAELEALELVKGRIRKADYTRHLQRLGLVGMEHDPEEYAAEVEDENAARATQFFREEADVGAPQRQAHGEDAGVEAGD